MLYLGERCESAMGKIALLKYNIYIMTKNLSLCARMTNDDITYLIHKRLKM